MRALIRDLRTGRFCGLDLQWTPRREDALDFGTSIEASPFVADNRLLGVEVVLTSDRPEDDVTMSLEVEPAADGPEVRR